MTGREAIDVTDLRYTYPGADRETLHGLSFAVERGEVFGFLGPSGAGKSTTQKVLTGLLSGYEGRATVLGREVDEWDGAFYDRVGISPETPSHYRKLTGRENLRLFASLHDVPTRDVDALFDLVGLSDAIDRRAGDYSKGMAMRLNLLRALVHDPELLFLDEPTAGIDPGNARTVKDVVAGLADDGRTVFCTTHDMAVAAELCDRVAFLVDGRVPLVGDPDELRREYGSRTVRVVTDDDGRETTARFPLDGLPDDPEFRALFADGRVESVHTEEATLETVFLEVTGESLVPGDPAASAEGPDR